VETASAEVPAGVEVVTMPRLSDTMTEGKVAKWHKNVGDTVKKEIFLLRSKQIKQYRISNLNSMEYY
jgi:multidrug efflux pump subunit AcrA (membrane-fusion protein)